MNGFKAIINSFLFGKNTEKTDAELCAERLAQAKKWLNKHSVHASKTDNIGPRNFSVDDSHDPTQAHLPGNIFNQENK